MRGYFITVEGGEGAGKTTQIRLLMEAFRQAGLTAMETREPGGTESAEEIRALLVRGDAGKWDATAELLLFYAARREHLARKILPALERGTHVVCDRFSDSTRAYQGYGKELGDSYVMALHNLTLGAFQPDLTLWLDMEVNTGLSRAVTREAQDAKAETRFETMGSNFHDRVREGFEAIAAREPGRIAHINAAQPIEAVHKEIIAAANERLGLSLPRQEA